MKTIDSIIGLTCLVSMAAFTCSPGEPPGPPLPPQLLIACRTTPPDTCKPEIAKAISEGCKVLEDISDTSINRREVILECGGVK
jgi:hypothetical protein